MTSDLCRRIQQRRVLVIGDLMLDRYTTGHVSRISPEAPVCVLKVEKEESRPGGAGNTVLNLLALGQEVVVVGRVGADPEGDQVCSGLKRAGADMRGMLVQSGYQTPLKNRLVASGQQMIRLDLETIEPLSSHLAEQLMTDLPSLVEGVDIIAISDYGKGLLSSSVLTAVLKRAQGHQIPVVVDPKGMDYSRYQGVTLLKPNEHEAVLASGLSDPTLEAVADRLLSSTQADHLMITRAEKGISLFAPSAHRRDFPTSVREVRDVTGAGDTVLATCAAALANGLSVEETSQVANQAAGIAVSRFGCARVSLEDLRQAAELA